MPHNKSKKSYGGGSMIKDGAKIPQGKANAMGIKPAQGVAQTKSGMTHKAGGKATQY